MKLIDTVLAITRLELLPVRVRHGVAAGAAWTLYPYTSYWRGTHEPALQHMLLALGNGNIRGWCCWDVGAHFGLYSIGLARRVGPGGEVAAFEPDPRSFARLQRHRRMNALSWLKLFEAAASDHANGAELFTYGALGRTTTHLPYEGEVRSDKVGVLPVRTVKLDALVTSGELRLPNFVKIDAEGHGHHVLAGMRETLAQSRPIVVASLHSPQERDGMLSLFDALGYAAEKIGGAPGAGLEIGADYQFTAALRAAPSANLKACPQARADPAG